MAAIRHLEFQKFAVFVMWSLTACRCASSHKILLKLEKKRFSRQQPSAILNFKKFNSDHVVVIVFSICCSVPNFIKIGGFFTEIWRFKDVQNGGRPPCWILKICRYCPVALVDLPFCFLTQNFAEIGQSVDDLWPKKLKNFNFWSRDCNRVQYLMQCTKFHQNRTIFHRDMAI